MRGRTRNALRGARRKGSPADKITTARHRLRKCPVVVRLAAQGRAEPEERYPAAPRTLTNRTTSVEQGVQVALDRRPEGGGELVGGLLKGRGRPVRGEQNRW